MIPVLRLAATAIAMTAAGGMAVAQDATPPAENDGSRYVPPVSVTATRNPVETFEYPGMVTVRDRRDIQDRQATSPDDILRTVPGVDFFGGPRRTGEVPSIRGFSGPDVILLLDGARQNFISGHDGQLFVDPLFLRRVEVVKGSSSALYGSGGTGGVIELRTVEAVDLLAPGGSWGGEVSAGYQGVNEEWTAGFVGAARPTERFEAVAGLTWLTGDDYRLGNDSSLIADDDIISGLLKGSARLAAHQQIEASWQRFRNDATEPNNGQDTGTDLVDKEVRTDNFRIAYNNSDPSNTWLDLDVIAYYVDSNVLETRLDNLGAGPAGQVEDRVLSTIGARVDNRTRFVHSETALTTLTYGVESYRDTGEGTTDGAARGVCRMRNRPLPAHSCRARSISTTSSVPPPVRRSFPASGMTITLRKAMRGRSPPTKFRRNWRCSFDRLNRYRCSPAMPTRSGRRT